MLQDRAENLHQPKVTYRLDARRGSRSLRKSRKACGLRHAGSGIPYNARRIHGNALSIDSYRFLDFASRQIMKAWAAREQPGSFLSRRARSQRHCNCDAVDDSGPDARR
jgi:hypothetical protein